MGCFVFPASSRLAFRRSLCSEAQVWALWRVHGAGQDGGRAGKLWFWVHQKTLRTFSLKSVTITCFLPPFLFLPSFFLFPFSPHTSLLSSLPLLPSSLPPSLLSSPFLLYLFMRTSLHPCFKVFQAHFVSLYPVLLVVILILNSLNAQRVEYKAARVHNIDAN